MIEGVTTKAKIVRVLDGDTVEVEISKRITVRLLDCWAPELNTEEGKASKAYLESIISRGQEVILQIPSSKTGNLSSLFTFGRVIGQLFNSLDENISEKMINEGHAKKKKGN